MLEQPVERSTRRTWLVLLLVIVVLALIYFLAADFARPGTSEVPSSGTQNSTIPSSVPERSQ